MGRSRWRRRWMIGGAAFLAVLAVALVVLWFALPRIVDHFARGAASDLGIDVEAMRISRADLSGLSIENTHASKDGADVQFTRIGADYSLGALLGGRVRAITVDGLAITLDFTKPRRGLLPDAITDLLAKIPHSDEPLVWPIDTLELKNCRLALVLPGGGTETFTIGGTATKRADGAVEFSLDTTHPEEELHVTGAVHTETLDGKIDIARAKVSPEALLGMTRRLGVFDLPAGNAIASAPLSLSGKLALRNGALASYELQAESDKIAYTVGGVDLSLVSGKLSGSSAADGKIFAHLTGALTASGKTTPWRAESLPLDLTLENGTVHGTAGAFAFTWADQLSSRLSLDVEYGIPALGGAPHAKLTASIESFSNGEVTLSPTTLTLDGWTDRLTISSGEIAPRIGGESLGSMRRFSAVITDPFGASRDLTLSTVIVAGEALRKRIPAGWQLREPGLPLEALRLDAHIALPSTGPSGTAKIVADLPRVELAAIDDARKPPKTFVCASSVEITATLDPKGIAASGTIGVSDIKTDMSKFPPGVQAMSFGVDVPPVSFAALGELAAGRVPKDEVAMKLKGSVSRGEAKGDAYLEVHHYGATSEWEAEAWVMLDNLNGAWAGTNVAGTRMEVTLNSGHLPDARVGEWMQAREVMPIVREVLPRSKFDVSITASSVDFPGKTRAEWSGFWIKKPPSDKGAPPLKAEITAYCGVLHSGPETIEQPSVVVTLLGGLDALDASAKFHALLEGSPVDFEATQKIAVNLADFSASGAGPFTVHPITLKNSDIISRWSAGAKGIVIGATVQATGALNWNSAGMWDGNADVSLSDGFFDYPDQKIRAEGIVVGASLSSLKNLRTLKDQPMSFARLVLGDVEMTNGAFFYSTDGGTHVQVDGARARIFGGDVSVGSFLLIFPDPDVGVVLEFSGIDAGELARQLKIFKGTLTGKLRGRLPLGLLAGKPILGEGYLELDPSVPASFSMDATGLFTTDLPNKSTKDKLVRLPYELAEEALRNVSIKTLHVDLFRRELPDTPIRLEFVGESVTPRATVPVDIVTNVKGSISQALDFLMRLATL